MQNQDKALILELGGWALAIFAAGFVLGLQICTRAEANPFIITAYILAELAMMLPYVYIWKFFDRRLIVTHKFNFRRWLYRWFGWWHKWQLRREVRIRENLVMGTYTKKEMRAILDLMNAGKIHKAQMKMLAIIEKRNRD